MQIKFLETKNLSNIAISSARTCYFPNGIVKPSQSENWVRKKPLLSSIFKAGHHSTLQHTNITMLITGISRHLIFRLLHSHSYYNSEQVSQRYAKMKIESFIYPKNADNKLWQNFYEKRFNNYEKLIEILQKDIENALPKFKKRDVLKKSQEFARYLLPQGMSAYMYHSVNITTILRYIAVAKFLPEVRAEAIEFARQLESELLSLDDSFKELIEYAKTESVTYPDIDMQKIKREKNITKDIEIFDLVKPLDFDLNQNYSNILRESQMLLDGANLGSFNSYIKLSLSADAQNQRHRRSPAIRSLLSFEPDFYIPNIIKKNQRALDIYKEANEQSYQFIENQRESVDKSDLVYALLNSHNIEIIENNDFNSFNHKAQMRLCFNAQEEIFDIVKEQVAQLREHNICNIDKYMPPCYLRAKDKIHPICPEGSRFCGKKVWKMDFKDLKREI